MGKYFVASYSLLSMGSLAQQIYLLELVREAVTLYTVVENVAAALLSRHSSSNKTLSH